MSRQPVEGARCSSEMPPSMQVNGHSFIKCLVVGPLMHAVAAWSRFCLQPI